MENKGKSIDLYLNELKNKQHTFENVFQSLARMLFSNPELIKPAIVNGKNTYDFMQFRMGKNTSSGCSRL